MNESHKHDWEEDKSTRTFHCMGCDKKILINNSERDEKVKDILRKLVVAKDGDAMLLRPHMRRLADEALVLMDGYDEGL